MNETPNFNLTLLPTSALEVQSNALMEVVWAWLLKLVGGVSSALILNLPSLHTCFI